MGKNPVYFLLIAFLVLVGIIGYRYDQYVLNREYLIDVDTVCDSASNSCFVADCSPEEDPACDTTPYSKVEVLARLAPACLQEHTCTDFTCAGIAGCTMTYCSSDAVEDGEVCAEPSMSTDTPSEN